MERLETLDGAEDDQIFNVEHCIDLFVV